MSDEVDEFLNSLGPVEKQEDEVDTFLNSLEPNQEETVDEVDTFLDEVGAPDTMSTTSSSLLPKEKETAPPPTDKTYSANDLVLDDYFYPIRDYMVERFGTHIKDMNRQDVVDKYLNNMRGFAGGNSVRSVSEIAFLNQAGENPDVMKKIGRAYEIYEGMENLYTGDTTWGETGSGTWDFIRTTVFDPVNLIGLGIGKTITSSGFKAGSQVAKAAARKTFVKEMAKAGATKEIATKAAEKTFLGVSREVAKAQAKKQAARQAVRNGVKRGLSAKILNKEATKEILTMGTFDGAIAAATDYMYQDAMLRTAVQDEYNVYQTGLNAIAGMVFMGGMAAGGAGLTGLSKIVKPGKTMKVTTKGAKLSELSPEIGKMMRISKKADGGQVPVFGDYGSWNFKVTAGKELQDQDFEFFTTMLLGNDTLGLKGLGEILQEQGYVWIKRNPDDKISNWIADIIKEADPQDAEKFLKDFTNATGIKMAEGKELTADKLADVFAKKMSDSMRLGNAASQLSRYLGKKSDSVTAEEYAQFVLFGRGATDETPSLISRSMDKVAEFKPEWLDDISVKGLQNGYIRLLVSNMSTTFLNVTGYAAASTLNSLSDFTTAALHAPAALIGKQSSRDTISAIARNQKWKLLNTLDVNMTYDRFMQYVEMRPKSMKELYRILPGGVEDVKKLASEGFDPNQTLLSIRGNQVVDFIQKVHLVQAQDSLTKSVEFTAQMDRILRMPKERGGMGIKGGWNEFFNRDDYIHLMNSETFAKAEAKAIDETLKSIYSKSYKGTDWVGEIAGVIEDARNIPVLGTMLPFGRFFNNTVAFMSDASLVWPLLRKSGFLVGKSNTSRSYGEIMARGATSWGLMLTAAYYEKEYKDQGLGIFEEIDPMTGAVKDERYEFPYAFWKVGGRIIAHLHDGEEIPPELKGQVFDQFIGQFTRQLGEAGTGMRDFFINVTEGNAQAIDALNVVSAQVISGTTRFMDPANQIVSIFRGKNQYVPDNRQGKESLNNSLRYMDNFADLLNMKERPPEKYSAARGDDLRPQTTKVFSTVRETRLTDTSRMMAALGRPDWDKMISQYSNTPEADNRFNQVFHNLIERGASRLIKTDKWKKGDHETKMYLANDLITKAKGNTRKFMERVGAGIEDNELRLMIQIQEKKRSTIRDTMDSIGYEGKELSELDYKELLNLKDALDLREEWKTR